MELTMLRPIAVIDRCAGVDAKSCAAEKRRQRAAAYGESDNAILPFVIAPFDTRNEIE
jgi:hypothetical protein